MTTTYWIDLLSKGAVTAVHLNGIEIAASWDGLPRVVSLDCGHAVLRGENRVEVLVAPREDEPEAQVTLYGIPEGQEKHEFERFLEWIGVANEIAPRGGESLERVVDHTFWLADAPDTWMWSRGRPFAKTEDTAALTALVVELHGALARKDLRALHKASRLSLAERAVALRVPPDRMDGEWLAALGESLVDDTLQVAPVQAEALTFVTSFGGRLVHARTADGRHPLAGHRGARGERAVVLPLAFAHLEGRWQVVR